MPGKKPKERQRYMLRMLYVEQTIHMQIMMGKV